LGHDQWRGESQDQQYGYNPDGAKLHLGVSRAHGG
jgi:hypothetical protein